MKGQRGKEEKKGRGREGDGLAPIRKFLDPPLDSINITQGSWHEQYNQTVDIGAGIYR